MTALCAVPASLTACARAAQRQEVRATTFERGDKVRVIDGDLRNLMGVVLSTRELDNTVVVRPKHHLINYNLKFQAPQLAKFFKVYAASTARLARQRAHVSLHRLATTCACCPGSMQGRRARW